MDGADAVGLSDVDDTPVYRLYVLPRWMVEPTTALPVLPPKRAERRELRSASSGEAPGIAALVKEDQPIVRRDHD
jgi:hypothetical protein